MQALFDLLGASESETLTEALKHNAELRGDEAPFCARRSVQRVEQCVEDLRGTYNARVLPVDATILGCDEQRTRIPQRLMQQALPKRVADERAFLIEASIACGDGFLK
jgi:hypothetical protein